MSDMSLAERSRPFVDFLEAWLKSLETKKLSEVIAQPEKAVIISLDITNGFCKAGPLSSPRVNALIQPIAALFEAAWAQGLRHIILSQDTHEPDALEFDAFPAHCVRGTVEAETVAEFMTLPFYDRTLVVEKNTISSSLGTDLDAWVDSHPEVDTFIVVGDCTDICVYQLALALRLQANELRLKRRVIVPQNGVDTYDLPVETARQIGALPHDGDLLHHVFLYHLALNAVEVIAGFDL